eukprot:35033-Amphidinium_carterae.1
MSCSHYDFMLQHTSHQSQQWAECENAECVYDIAPFDDNCNLHRRVYQAIQEEDVLKNAYINSLQHFDNAQQPLLPTCFQTLSSLPDQLQPPQPPLSDVQHSSNCA